jgi:hypothetical protein
MRRFALYAAAALLLWVAMLTMNTRACRRAVSELFGDHLTVCTCGSRDLAFQLVSGPPGSVHSFYRTTCTRCGEKRQVLDVAWDAPWMVIDAMIEAAAQEPPDDLE